MGRQLQPHPEVQAPRTVAGTTADVRRTIDDIPLLHQEFRGRVAAVKEHDDRQNRSRWILAFHPSLVRRRFPAGTSLERQALLHHIDFFRWILFLVLLVLMAHVLYAGRLPVGGLERQPKHLIRPSFHELEIIEIGI